MKTVLVIGAGFLQSFVIAKAKKMGYFTLAVDGDPNAVGFTYADDKAVINIVDEEACLAYAKEKKINGVLTAATDYGVLTAARIAHEMNLPGVGYEAAKLVKNKYRVRKCLFEHHVDDTEQAYEVNGDTNIAEMSKQLVYPVMVKPCDGSGSRGTSRVDHADQLNEACQYAMNGSITHRAEIESFVVGKEYGADTLVVDGIPHVMGIMKKWMTEPPYYAELGHAIPCDLEPAVEAKAEECVKKAIKALGIHSGAVNMDMLITEDGKVHIVDIGARMGGNMIGPCVVPYGTGIDYMGNIIRTAVGDPLDWTTHDHGKVATRLMAFQSGVVKKAPDVSLLEQKYGVEIYHHMSVGDDVREYHTNLDGCGYIIARADTIEAAISHANAALENIQAECF